MRNLDLTVVPEQHRDNARTAIRAAFGDDASGIEVVTGGASGALAFRVQSTAGPHLLRVETIKGPMRNPHQYECMQIAADADIAPPIRYVDADAGVVVIPFLTQRSLADFAGGAPALAAAAARLLAQLHETEPFATHGDYMNNLAGMLGYLERSGRVAPGLLDRHRHGFEQIRAAYPWQPDTFVSAHNDPNQFNLLYDGDRLWLVDWETASRNDPFIDVATVVSHLGTTPELRDLILTSWLGRAADPSEQARLALARRLITLYAGCILLAVVVDPASPTHSDLTAMSVEEFRAGIESGAMGAGEIATTLAFAKISLQAFLDNLATPEFDAAQSVVASG